MYDSLVEPVIKHGKRHERLPGTGKLQTLAQAQISTAHSWCCSLPTEPLVLSLPTCDLLSAHLGAPEHVHAGECGAFDRHMGDEWRRLFVLAPLRDKARRFDSFSSGLQHLGGEAEGAMEGFLFIFNEF